MITIALNERNEQKRKQRNKVHLQVNLYIDFWRFVSC